ncbi:helix-turn-helix transcriptional regulator [Maricaulis virginensis]|uniref:Helix-turn-helix transcriptional regulator n=1 Tax=Maricaulis virginensis TaxID=144022 RepID=A0A9W6IKU5_9PROT|nr:response regulator transcription factor [Maricaulis virginensis]GLK51818.1 helix-turn-helix transcriptional regulator [Maricaulis virginensis]
MRRTILIFAVVLALAVFALEWLEYRFWARRIGVELFVPIVGTGCIVLGIWLGVRLTRQAPPQPFERNDRAMESLGLTRREYDVLRALVMGDGNKAMARRLGVSPNTVKTHIARLYDKLDVSSRVQAIEKARALRLIPSQGDPVAATVRSGENGEITPMGDDRSGPPRQPAPVDRTSD